MDFIIELFSEIILECGLEFIFEGVFSKKIPKVLRIIFAIMLLVIYGALTIGLIILGVAVDNTVILLIGIFITIISALAIIKKLTS